MSGASLPDLIRPPGVNGFIEKKEVQNASNISVQRNRLDALFQKASEQLQQEQQEQRKQQKIERNALENRQRKWEAEFQILQQLQGFHLQTKKERSTKPQEDFNAHLTQRQSEHASRMQKAKAALEEKRRKISAQDSSSLGKTTQSSFGRNFERRKVSNKSLINQAPARISSRKYTYIVLSLFGAMAMGTIIWNYPDFFRRVFWKMQNEGTLSNDNF